MLSLKGCSIRFVAFRFFARPFVSSFSHISRQVFMSCTLHTPSRRHCTQIRSKRFEKERIKEIVDQIKRDSVELFSYELKLRRNAQGEYYNAHIEIKVKRDNYNEVLMNRMSDFDDVTITRIE